MAQSKSSEKNVAKAAKDLKASKKIVVTTTAAQSESGRGLRKYREGLVVSNKMEKTIVVAVTRQVKHPVYGKYVRSTNKFYAHDEAKLAGVGDLVRIVETKPLSKLKRWKLDSTVRKAA